MNNIKNEKNSLKYKGVDGLQERSTYRVPRASALLKKFINLGLQTASDSELACIRISKVEISPDFSEATVWFFSVELEEEKIFRQKKKLEKSVPFLKRYLSKNVLLRRLPTFRFKPDLNGIELLDYSAYSAGLNEI